MSIGSRITEARKRLGLTQETLAKKISVSKGAIANYENGVSVPKTEIMYRLFEALDVDANFLYQDDMATPPRGVSLSIDEARLLTGYRSLTIEGKSKVQEYLQDMAIRYQDEKNNGVPVSGTLK